MIKATAATVCVCLTILMMAVSAQAMPSITAGTWYLEPNKAHQVVTINTIGTDLVQGLEFCVQVGGGTAGPALESVDILTGTIFASSNNGTYSSGYVNPYTAYEGTTTSETTDLGYGAGFVSANGKLATLKFNTTGMTSGKFSFSLTGPEGVTNFAGLAATVSDGFVGIAPQGDANHDGVVDVLDLGILATNWQTSGKTWSQGDFNGDGVIDVLDLGILATNWQAKAGGLSFSEAMATIGVPEPTSVAVLLSGLAIRLARRRRGRA